MALADPFGTAALRESVLVAWESSPTRLREDAAAEADLVRAGYRDRVFTELAQNAADAAAKAAAATGRAARSLPLCSITVWATDRELHIANTGAPLDTAGVQALAALRASDKEARPTPGPTVGRFGVGFTSVRAISDEIEIRSTSGSVLFSAERTRAAVAERGIAAPVDPPTLRLPWPAKKRPRTGADTEVVLHLRAGVDARELLGSIIDEATDLLLELPALEIIKVGDTELRRTVKRMSHGVALVSIGVRSWWQFATDRARWLLPVEDGRPIPAGNDVLRAPTRSDEELSLPALVVADVEMQPDRRRLLPGADIAALAKGYAKFARALPPPLRLLLVPRATFARSEADRLLRDALRAELRARTWLPVVGNHGGVRPPTAAVLPGLTPELAELLAEAVPALVIPELSDSSRVAVLSDLGVRPLGLADVTEALSGLDRPPAWWHRLYAALEPLLVDRLAGEELGALPVPLADGRLVTGPRTTMVGELAGAAELPVHWARLVHPVAAHPLLGRLGAQSVTALDLLRDPALRSELEATADPDTDGDLDGRSDGDLADAVLALAADVADPGQLPSWLGLLPLPDADGELRPVDELLLPRAPLAGLLDDDAPFGTIDPAVVARFGVDVLRAIGAVWSFGVLRESDPTGPDHDLDDESAWWDWLPEDPAELVAVRDLELVAAHAWPAALELLAHDPRIQGLLGDRNGYTAWWLRRHACVHGQLLGMLLAPGATAFAGLLDPLDHPDADAFAASLADPDSLNGDLIVVLAQRLSDPDRRPTPATVADTHRRLAEGLAHGLVEPSEIPLPQQIRAVSGALIAPDDALVLDRPWLAAAIPADRLVVGDLAGAADLAALLDVRLASEAVHATVTSTGRVTSWEDDPLGVLVRATLALRPDTGPLVVHAELTVKLTGAVTGTARVPWWVTEDGTTHLQQP
ncbi:ATP-binding protein [Aldersonia sp. NBC_00410]|uniref:sacsin N-terminal ATP-binding-like domain-containing protein n=1 Tax=Aldersonia sp. NBC_00410 TaxID=2975954 RepID=UPI00225BC767|nr:ATP-binding protein [Aldersonia sp. NBC_00410]MCX5045711.1 ATP-binding protein [Aldersonia sp. NBC_00410]